MGGQFGVAGLPVIRVVEFRGIGSQERSRNCTRPSPSYGGKPCPGAEREKQICNKQPCSGKNALQRITRIYT